MDEHQLSIGAIVMAVISFISSIGLFAKKSDISDVRTTISDLRGHVAENYSTKGDVEKKLDDLRKDVSDKLDNVERMLLQVMALLKGK